MTLFFILSGTSVVTSTQLFRFSWYLMQLIKPKCLIEYVNLLHQDWYKDRGGWVNDVSEQDSLPVALVPSMRLS